MSQIALLVRELGLALIQLVHDTQVWDAQNTLDIDFKYDFLKITFAK